MTVPSAHSPEPDTIELARRGDHAAFRQLYEEHVGPLYRFLGQFSRRSDETEEWVQRAFIKAFRHLGSFDRRSKFSTWIFQIGLNEMRTDRRPEKVVPLSQDEDLDTLPEPEAFLDGWTSSAKYWLDRLDDQRRSVFILHEVEGYSHAEIALSLGITEGHSRTILTRTKAWLRHRLEAERKVS